MLESYVQLRLWGSQRLNSHTDVSDSKAQSSAPGGFHPWLHVSIPWGACKNCQGLDPTTDLKQNIWDGTQTSTFLKSLPLSLKHILAWEIPQCWETWAIPLVPEWMWGMMEKEESETITKSAAWVIGRIFWAQKGGPNQGRWGHRTGQKWLYEAHWLGVSGSYNLGWKLNVLGCADFLLVVDC